MLSILERGKKLNKRNVIIACVMTIAAVVVVAGSLANATDVRLDTVKKGMLRGEVELRGKVELKKKEKVFSKLVGTIKSINVKEGEEVDVNTVLAKIDVQDMNLALGRAQEAYKAAKASLEDYKTSVKPEEVRQADAQVEQARIAVDAAQMDYAYKKNKYEKVNSLYRQGGVSEQELKDAELMVASAQSALNDAKQRYEIARNSLNRIKKGVSEHGIQAAEANEEQARLQVEELENNLGRASVFPGMKGKVLDRYVEEGEYVQPGSLLYEIGDDTTAYIRVDVLADDAEKIKTGQKALICGEVLEDKEIQGDVYFIAPKADSKVSTLGVEQQRVEVRIRYDNSAFALKYGYGVDVNIITDEKQSAVFVPDKAVFDMNGKDNVFVVKDGKLALKAVKTGIENDDYTEVIEGLSEGEKIVVDPDNKLKPGMKVK